MASLSSRRNSSSSAQSPSRRSSRMDSLCEEDGSVFTPPHSPILSRAAGLNETGGARNRSPSLPVSVQPIISRSRSPSLPIVASAKPGAVVDGQPSDGSPVRSDRSFYLADLPPERSERNSRVDLCGDRPDRLTNRSNSAYTDRSDSGISDCSHSSLMISFSKPIHEEDENELIVNGAYSPAANLSYS